MVKLKISPQSSKIEFLLQNQYGCVILMKIDEKLYVKQEKIYYWGSKK
jgi:hypothetical protein